MDRQIVYPGSIPLDTDILSLQRNAMVAIGYLAQAALGTNMVADGLPCLPTAPASLTVSVGPGSITSFSVIDATAFGSLPADNTDPLVKMGINTTATGFTLTAPAVSGQAINYLVQATLAETDANAIVLPYYNAANPSQPFSGAANSGTSQNTQRLQRVQLQLKPSAPANAGSQITPPVDAGWIGLWIVTLNYGQSQITPASITPFPGAPFIAFKLNTLTPGYSRIATYHVSGSFTAPAGSTSIKVRLAGGGGGGAAGYCEGIVAVAPGQTYTVFVGQGGTGGVPGGAAATTGGTSSFGTAMSATGGAGGGNAASFAFGGLPGSGQGASVSLTGGFGTDGNAGNWLFTGNGGASQFGGGGRAAAAGGALEQNGTAPGSGGGACYGVAGLGGNGAPGIVIVEF